MTDALTTDKIDAMAAALLAVHDDFMAGHAADEAVAKKLHRAAIYGAAAYDACPMQDAAPGAMLRALLIALIDPMNPQLDYLRAVQPTDEERGRNG